MPSLSPGQVASTMVFPTGASSRELLLVSIDPQSALPTLFMSSASPRALGAASKKETAAEPGAQVPGQSQGAAEPHNQGPDELKASTLQMSAEHGVFTEKSPGCL